MKVRVGAKGLIAGLLAAGLLGSACASTSPAASGGSPPPPSTSSTGGSGGGGYGDRSGSGGKYGGGGSGSVAPDTVLQGSGGFVFSPVQISVKEGAVLTVQNVGSASHTFTVSGSGIDVVNAAGATQKVTIDLKPGTYEFICRFHVNLGMKGTLVVTS